MIRLTVDGGRAELRHLPLDWLRPGVAHVVADLELVADAPNAEAILYASEPWLEASLDGGGFVAVGTERAGAVDLGSFVAGERKALELRVTVPAATPPRRHLVELRLGLGA